MSYDAKVVYELRNRSGAGVMECKKALEETKGDIEKACELLRKKGIETAAKKQNRSTEQGLIGSYVHTDGKIGVLVEVNCETDFVARTEEFISFVKELTLQIAAQAPRWVAIEDVPEDIRKEEEKIYQAQLSESGKPEAVQKKIIEGKLNKFYQDNCLLEQEYIRDNDKKIKELLVETIAKVGENIVIKRFVRLKLGEE
ncbi:MAG TPA: translation elongation factor Ts [Atribacter sp.]|jgi:elongation factor Ts|uniref:Elongation factor Ts n=1 Tax=Candidatus Atribacter allofermentans TaxID=1852833 RepID=A0A1V5T3C2_9BACT|nr:translation elongation factor Ts [Atribacter sp.]MDD3713234.1 translation elongation factor Ts [Atribacterota bacterium]OQA61259.1 MAG: Elongation factor Ts [Candidatus Atribacteria bacterium ADurb.Bin276]HHT11358.1 translation elongation factor Ts [Candidatus Atribacteria bacterium]MDI9595752.1 translation elongation factor Ts [Atribacterota bacterium]HOT04790.1 translation elongation factor Ts [Atribacter sp.]